jgi:hypothetical protein
MRNLVLTLIIFTSLTGCKSTRPTALDHSLLEYQNGQWILSEMWAKKSIKSNKDVAESQYMMGLCEFKLKHIEVSKEWFTKASHSPKKEVQGKATAMLGIISANEGNIEDAEIAFANAAIALEGVDKQEANLRISTGNSMVTSSNSFTLQFGAFRDKSNANSAMNELSSSLKQAGIQTVWIKEDSDRTGRKLYLVQAGHFATRSAASTRRNNGNLPQCIVTAED